MVLKGPKERYSDEEISPGVRTFVLEHAQFFKRFMHDTWKIGLTISGMKCGIDVPGITIVEMVCDYDGRHPDHRNVAKIIAWPIPQLTKDPRAFISIVVYYCIFIISFAINIRAISEGDQVLMGHQNDNTQRTNLNDDSRRP